MADRYIDFIQLAKDLDVRRERIRRWCNRGLLLARKPTPEEKALVVIKQGRVYLKRVNMGRQDPRTRREWVEAFLAVITPE
jgi:hypothetical protein